MPDPVAAISAVFTYFNPSRSPYYTMGLAACFAITYVCDVGEIGPWLTLFVPIFIVAGLTLALSLDSRNSLTNAEQAEQLRFARSTCISVALLALALAGKAINDQKDVVLFTINTVLCCLQILLFLINHWALNRQDVTLSDPGRNYVQITLLTSAFLGDTAYNLAVAANKNDTGHSHHLWTAVSLGLLWACCVAFWLWKLAKIVGRPGDEPGKAGSAALTAAAAARNN